MLNDGKISILNFTKDELKTKFDKPFRSKQIFNALYQKFVSSFDEITTLSKTLRKELTDNFLLYTSKIIKKETSQDKSIKYLIQLHDKHTIETVLLPMKEELKNEKGEIVKQASFTVCISTQVGCKIGCAFCLTAKGGFVRNLETSEIVEQLLLVKKDNNYPPHNREKVFDFADYSAPMMALEDIYGLRGGRVMGMRIGRATFMDLLSNYGAMVGVTDLAFKILPVSIKLRIGINAMAKVFNMVSDQETEVVEYENYFHYIVKQCPVCWGRHDEEKPVCFSQVGLIKGGLNWVTNGKEFNVKEIYCHAMGDEHCTFRILKTPIDY